MKRWNKRAAGTRAHRAAEIVAGVRRHDHAGAHNEAIDARPIYIML